MNAEKEEYNEHFHWGRFEWMQIHTMLPEHRRKGLAKAVIYEACRRAKNLGAKRATVLSEQDFYYKIGFKCSSEVYCWRGSRMERLKT